MDKTKKIAIVGLGWLGLPLAEQLCKKGYSVIGSVSSVEKLHTYGHLPFCVSRIKINEDQLTGDWESFLFGAEVLVITIPPHRTENIERIYPAQIEQILKHTPAHLKVIFTSTTGVYANQGKAVDETTASAPEKPSGKAVKYAEEKLNGYFGNNLTILRFGGLIGPDRHPGKFLAGKRPLRNGEAPVNLVHQHDCIAIIEKVLEQNYWGEILNVCASKHPIRKDYYFKAASLLQLPPPIFKKSDVQDFKIVNNSKSKEALQYNYKFDDPEVFFQDKHPGKVSIVGAGPGDKHLLTLKGYKAIKEADTVLHDNLVSEEILQIPSNAELIYVGRKFADKSDQQERQQKINELLHHHYKQGKKVVRLKSGDPYIYGRAAEEARYLNQYGVPFEVIPGISAALAAANINNIPITERHRSNAIMICTAHTADYSFDQLNGVAALLKSGNTLAIYMGLKSLDRLIPKLIEVCQNDSIPITAISNVSRKNERVVSSTLKEIRSDLMVADLPMPVVFIVGAKSITQNGICTMTTDKQLTTPDSIIEKLNLV